MSAPARWHEPLCEARSAIFAGWSSFLLECELPAGHEPAYLHQDPEYGLWEGDREW